jgi:hypothetical protein
MDGAVVGVDDELAVGLVGVFFSADQKFQGEMFEHEIVGGFKFVIGKYAGPELPQSRSECGQDKSGDKRQLFFNRSERQA